MNLHDIIKELPINELLNIKNYGKSFCFTNWYKNNTWHPLVIAKYGSPWWMLIDNTKTEEIKRAHEVYLSGFGGFYQNFNPTLDINSTRESMLKLIDEKLEQNDMYVILKDLGRAISSEFLSLHADIIYSKEHTPELWYMTFNNDMHIILENSELILTFDRSYYANDLAAEAAWIGDIKNFSFQLADPDYVSKLCNTIKANYQVM